MFTKFTPIRPTPQQVLECEVDGTGSGFCPVADFDIGSVVESSGFCSRICRT